MRTTLENFMLPHGDVLCLENLGKARYTLVAPGLDAIYSQTLSPLPSIEPFLHASHCKEPLDTTLSQFSNSGACLPGGRVQGLCDSPC